MTRCEYQLAELYIVKSDRKQCVCASVYCRNSTAVNMKIITIQKKKEIQQYSLLLCMYTKNESITKKTISASDENECVASVTKDREEKGRGCGWKCASVQEGGGPSKHLGGRHSPTTRGPLFVAPPSFVFEFKRLLLSNK